ncbi:glutamine--fructose-6-phosphate transaminase (isomerizing) [Synechococcus sp. JA-3-3Ab]|uniref:glutamine--fructose-6-phosphate transaminase (isomerizing) n=1 Tax=Synechococcus sp. (strain JA-3-3Ab) TaxID=321327 RepID=UPI0000694468|nr:glutamine--fructose-6-phosphate transaminase (isomerizing) [Synechococcus sp. JA-3-3Ab]ABC99709.1 glucosamine--fructose-6-phosphate aminotransferase, isomerizing [Synechococcus sp. JA-3-3Ab]
MCGIVGYVGFQWAAPILVEGLRTLEYRGYDSAGIATVDPEEGLRIVRAAGKLHNLVVKLTTNMPTAKVGIGHTRWATHGGISEENAHPHCDVQGRVVVIQNGIVENYLELKEELLRRGVTFRSQTDTEVIAQLLGLYVEELGSFEVAFGKVMGRLRGGNAVVALDREAPDRLIAARLGNAGAVVIGEGEGENFVASDLPAIIRHTRRVVFLEDGEMAILTDSSVRYQRITGEELRKTPLTVAWDPVSAAKGGYKHFMQKEIHEQPRTITETLRGRVDLEAGRVNLEGLALTEAQLAQVEQIHAVACGTAWHACLVLKYFIESLARTPVQVDYASEFRYRQPVLRPHSLLVALTQSGETVDTLAAMSEARTQGIPTLAIVNAIGSQATRLADAGVIYIHAGPEIAVASTKVFTGMLVAGYLLALQLAQAKGILSPAQIRSHLQALIELPGKISLLLKDAALYEQLAEQYHHVTDMLYLGRWVNAPIALEGALKMKEVSYIHAEGYPAGEMKHGPIALIDERMPVVCIATRDPVYEKMLSNIEQVRARGGRVIALINPEDTQVREKADHVIEVPSTTPLLSAVLNVIPLQLFAYAMALRRGADVDQPRNLAKSVTVE